MNIVLLAPHQDDEIISSFGLLYTLSQSNNINIIFATNGDFHGKETAIKRYYESTAALALCNIPLQNIYYMGYADTGMQKEQSFLYNLYRKNENEIFTTGHSEYTYHPIGEKTVHVLFFGQEANYTKKNFITDLNCILSKLRPDLIILPSFHDFHGDHAGLSLFFNQYVIPSYKGMTYHYLVHTENDWIWPNRNTDAWCKPVSISDILWKSRISIPLSNKIKERKTEAILCFQSQHPYDQDSFLLSFAKNEELFFN